MFEIDDDIFLLKPVFIFQRLAVRPASSSHPKSATLTSLYQDGPYINLFCSVGDSL